MPIFAYRCATCGATEDKLQKRDAPEQHSCHCGDGVMKRELGTSSFVLKGTGWYKPGPSPR